MDLRRSCRPPVDEHSARRDDAERLREPVPDVVV
jgi:hypothetical protein